MRLKNRTAVRDGGLSGLGKQAYNGMPRPWGLIELEFVAGTKSPAIRTLVEVRKADG
jgi:hypothetical protein